jgi:hypothetical protein
MAVRETGLTVRFSAERRAKLAATAEVEDRSQGAVVRRLVDSLPPPLMPTATARTSDGHHYQP